jgi:cell division protein FtsW
MRPSTNTSFEPQDSNTTRVFGTGANADPWLICVTMALVAFGVVMVYGASSVFASRHYHNGHYYLIKQTIYAVIGLTLMLGLVKLDYHWYRRLTYPALLLGVVLLIAAAAGVGRRVGGAARWIQVGPVSIQPSEIVKLSLVLWLAYSLSKKNEWIRSFSIGFLPHVLMAGVLMVLCLAQPDFGSAVMIGVLTFVLLFTAGARLGYILGALLIALPLAYAVVATSEYRMRRMRAYLEPFKHRYDIGYQISESLMSFGAGGFSGVGLGDSRQKLFFLPEAHTDFISAIIGEELGFVGVAAVVFMFCVLVYRGLRIAVRAPDDYGTYIAAGITMFIGLQAFTNLSVAMGLLPTKGLGLPFISYGGSSLLVNCAAVGMLLNISTQCVFAAPSTSMSADVAQGSRDSRGEQMRRGSYGMGGPS